MTITTMHSTLSPISTHEPRTSTFPKKLLQFFETVMTSSTGYHCAKNAHRLMALSDQQLNEIGLQRDEIVRYAFRNHAMF
jgi:uncharacterized protein YjiS (DUF1127 family)